MGLFGGGTTTSTQATNQQTQYTPDPATMANWQNIIGTGQGLASGLINNSVYPGNPLAPPTQGIQDWWNRTNTGTNAPDTTGVQRGMTDLGGAMINQYRDPNQVNLPGTYNFAPGQIQLPNTFAGGTPNISAPGNGPSGLASSYYVNPQQVQAPSPIQAQQVQAPGAINPITGLMQVSGPQLQQYQMGPAGLVNAPSLQNYTMQAAQNVAPQSQVSTQSWTDPGTAAAFMSPYTQQVLDLQKQRATEDYNQQLEATRGQAAQAGAFGGTRQAVLEATGARDLAERQANIDAQGLQAAYQQGQQQFNQQQQLGLQGQQFNVQSGLQAALANQGTQQQANLQNLAAYLQTQGLGAQTGLQAQLANQQAGLTVGGQNLASQLQTQGLGAQLGMQAQLANQQQGLQSALANQQAQEFGSSQQMQAQLANQQSSLQAALANAGYGMQGSLANQAAGIQTGLAAQQMGLTGAQFNAGQGLQAALANQAAAMQGLGMQYQGGLSSALQGQQLGLQGQIASGQLGLTAAQQQEALRQAQQGMNLSGFNQAGNLYNQSGQLGLQGFASNLAGMGMQQQGAISQQGQAQQGADTAYQNWLMSNLLPMQATNWLAQLQAMQPLPYSQTSSGTSYGSSTAPAPGIGGILGGLLGGVGSVMSGLHYKEGGPVRERRGLAEVVPIGKRARTTKSGLGRLLKAA